jgi:hypothetical protein
LTLDAASAQPLDVYKNLISAQAYFLTSPSSTSHDSPFKLNNSSPSLLLTNPPTIIMSDAQVAGGHKANLKNPNTSQESKENSKKVLDNEYNGGDGKLPVLTHLA